MVSAATDNGASLIFQRAGEIGLGGLKSGNEAEDYSGENSNCQIEEKNAKVGRARDVHAAGIGWQIDFHESAISPEGDGEAGESTENGERKTFDQKLADDARA